MNKFSCDNWMQVLKLCVLAPTFRRTLSIRLKSSSHTVRSKGSRTEFFTAFLPTPSTGPKLDYVVETVSHKVQFDVSVVAVVVKTERLALTLLLLCVNVVRWLLRRNNVWGLHFAVKSIFRLQRLWN